MVQINQKRGPGVENLHPRSFWCGFNSMCNFLVDIHSYTFRCLNLHVYCIHVLRQECRALCVYRRQGYVYIFVPEISSRFGEKKSGDFGYRTAGTRIKICVVQTISLRYFSESVSFWLQARHGPTIVAIAHRSFAWRIISAARPSPPWIIHGRCPQKEKKSATAFSPDLQVLSQSREFMSKAYIPCLGKLRLFLASSNTMPLCIMREKQTHMTWHSCCKNWIQKIQTKCMRKILPSGSATFAFAKVSAYILTLVLIDWAVWVRVCIHITCLWAVCMYVYTHTCIFTCS